MNEFQACVAQFHKTFGMPAPTKPTLEHFRFELRASLILEEAREFAEAAGAPPDWPKMIDALCDLLYVTFGAAVEMGIDLAPFFDLVHRANMAKVGGPIREDGKQLKPPDWKPPDIAGLLEEVLKNA